MSEPFLQKTHNSSTEDTIGKFFYKNGAITEGQDLIDFLRYKPEGIQLSNIEEIFDKYSHLQFEVNKNSKSMILDREKSLIKISEIENLPLNIGTTLRLPKDQQKIEMFSVRGKNLLLQQREFNYFFADKLWELLNDPNYIKSENFIGTQGRGFDIEVMMENVQVWIWSRALNKIIDISPFVTTLNSEKSDVGSFSITVNPIKNLSELESIGDSNIINYFILNKDRDHEIDFFFKNFQYNDIVFLRFEKLKLEEHLKEDSDKTTFYDFEVNKNQLPGQIWDMIGLIDTCVLNDSFQNSNYEVTISGRDLMKLLVEDGSYFMNLALLQGKGEQQIIYGYTQDEKWFKRNISDGTYGNILNWFPTSPRSISDTVGFIINQLSNLGVLEGEDLFSAYDEDKRTQQYIVSGKAVTDEKENGSLKVQYIDGVWQIIHLLQDNSVKNRLVVDSSLAYVDGTILEQFNKLCQKPFVEFFGDTYGNEFNLIVRQPPFVRDSIISFLQGTRVAEDSIRKWTHRNKDKKIDGFYKIIDIEAKDIQGYNSLQYDTTSYAWYQLNPNDNMLGKYSKLAAGNLIPIIPFTRIAEIYGNHRLIIPDNYLFSNVLEGKESELDMNIYRRELLNDLKFVIDSNVYLPFTRKGSITLSKGDRRIKKGIFIRVLPTREIFYVDSVTNFASFNSEAVYRTTTLQVSRGMIEDYILGSNGYEEDGKIIQDVNTPLKFSYFDIATTIVKGNSHQVEVEVPVNSSPKTGWLTINTAVESRRKLVEENFPDNEVDNALRIMMAESHGSPLPDNVNWGVSKTSKYLGSRDRGLFQINNVSHPEVTDDKVYQDEYNIQQAARIFKERGWSEWSTSKIPGVISNGIVSSKTKKVYTHKIDMSKSDIEDRIKNNPGRVRGYTSKEILSFDSLDSGYQELITRVIASQLKGDSVEKFFFDENPSILEFRKSMYLFVRRPEISRSTRSLMSSIDTYVAAKGIAYAMTKTQITTNSEDVLEDNTQYTTTKQTKTVYEDNFYFKLNDKQFDFFLKRKQLNIYKYGKNN